MLEEMQITGFDQLNMITGKLGVMQRQREIKLLEGSFDMSDVVFARFRIKATGQVWELRCVNDQHGSGYLKKV
jgi:hypothetical protein